VIVRYRIAAASGLAVAICACSHGAGSASGGEALEEAPSSATFAAAPAAPEPGPASETPATDAACGRSDLPDCPLQAWMKANMAHQAMDGDVKAVERGFTKLAGTCLDGYPDWSSTAQAAAVAAHRGDLEAARRGCKQCHEEYRAKYRAERRAAPFR
jgi:hypothetical protein